MLIKTLPVTKPIVLRQIQTSDASEIFQTIDRQRQYLGKWLPFVAFTKQEADTFRFIQTIVEENAAKREYVFVILHEGCFAGVIGFKDTDRLNQRTEIGYWLAEEMQGKGIVTQSVKKMCHFAFEELGINRIQIKCAVGNFPSKKVPRRLNFHLEGIERDGELLAGGQFTNLEVYSLLKSEFKSAETSRNQYDEKIKL